MTYQDLMAIAILFLEECLMSHSSCLQQKNFCHHCDRLWKNLGLFYHLMLIIIYDTRNIIYSSWHVASWCW